MAQDRKPYSFSFSSEFHEDLMYFIKTHGLESASKELENVIRPHIPFRKNAINTSNY
jgi:hypothetical protein